MLRRLVPLPLIVIALGVFIAFALSSSSSVRATDQFPTKRPIKESQPLTSVQFGSKVAVGDIDNDGNNDIVATAPYANSNVGKVVAMLGPCYFWTVTFSVDGLEQNSKMGLSLAVADVNHDGIDDVVTGAPYAPSGGTAAAGKVFVFEGWQRTAQTHVASKTTPDIVLTDPSPQSNGHFGWSVAVGNIGTYVQNPRSADIQNDVIVGAPDKTTPMSHSGAAYVFWSGAQSHVSALSAPQGSGSTNNEFGSALAVGRFDGSHMPANDYADLLVGAWSANELGYNGAGEVDIYKGKNGFSDRLDTDARIVSSQLSQGAHFGQSIAVGNPNGDGFDDAIIGAPAEATAGAAYVVEGRNLPPYYVAITTAEHRIGAPSNGATGARYFGWTVATGKVDGDEYDDIVVSSYNDQVGTIAGAGLVYVWSGTQLDPIGDPITLQDPFPQGGAQFGYGGAAVANLDQEPGADIVVGSPSFDIPGFFGTWTNAGEVVLFGTGPDFDNDGVNDSCDNCSEVANPARPAWPYYGSQPNSDSMLTTFQGWTNAPLSTGHATTYTDYTIPLSGNANNPLGPDFQYWDDFQGDACQADMDRDGLTNDQETSGSACNGYPSDPASIRSWMSLDTDPWLCRSSVPKDVISPFSWVYPPEGTTQSDGDGIPDIMEAQKYATLPDNADTDGDGLSDGTEVFDVTGDGAVDGADAWSVCASYKGQVAYNGDLDLNKDGVVNSTDMQWMNTKLATPIYCP